MAGKKKDPNRKYSPNWGAPPGGRSNGPPTKAERGLRKHKKLSITLPPDLYDRVLAQQGDEPLSNTIARLIKAGLQSTTHG